MILESETPSHSKPPRARLAFRVGIVGHRPDRLRHANRDLLASKLHETLVVVKNTVQEFPKLEGNEDMFTSDAPLLCAVSPLAEGSDRLFAERALSLGYALCCPMPFPKDQYEEDFKPGKATEDNSLVHFNELLKQARENRDAVTFELDGDRSKEGKAYEEAGRIVANQSDLLVVIWDGHGPPGEGGTVQTLREALNFRVPILWIDAVAPHPWQLLRSSDDLGCLDTGSRCIPTPTDPESWDVLRKLVLEALRPPSDKEAKRAGPVLREPFFSECRPHLNYMIWWKLFRDLIGSGKLHIPRMRVRDFEATVVKDWPSDAPGVAGWINKQLRVHYAWADGLADLYADRYRSTYVVAYLLAAAAVFLALLPSAASWHGLPRLACIVGELICLIIILVLVYWSRHRQWHDRWIQYRLLAELIRQLRLLVPLGGGVPLPRLPDHQQAYGDPSTSWMHWHTRALARTTGLATGKADRAWIEQSLKHLQQVVTEQSRFHEEAGGRSKCIDHRLHLVIFVLLLVTITFVTVHLFLHFSGESWLILGCASLPALGAALAGIMNQAEFARIAKRSVAMSNRLREISRDIAALSAPKSTLPSSIHPFHEARLLAVRTSRLMLGELLDWNVIFLDRPPEVP